MDSKTAPVLERPTKTKFIKVGDLIVALEDNRVMRDHRLVPLTKLEFKVLLTLLLHAFTRVSVSRQTLTTELWGSDGPDSVNNLKVHLSKLRKKFEREDSSVTILNDVKGYFFADKNSAHPLDVSAE